MWPCFSDTNSYLCNTIPVAFRCCVPVAHAGCIAVKSGAAAIHIDTMRRYILCFLLLLGSVAGSQAASHHSPASAGKSTAITVVSDTTDDSAGEDTLVSAPSRSSSAKADADADEESTFIDKTFFDGHSGQFFLNLLEGGGLLMIIWYLLLIVVVILFPFICIGVIIYLLMRDRRRRRTSWQGSPSMPAADQPLPRGMQQPVALNPKQVKDRAVVRIALGLGLAAVSYYYDWHLLLAVGLLLVIVYAVKYYMACRDQQNDRRDE